MPSESRADPILMRRKVLIVEDDPDQLELIRISLKDAGLAIGTAVNGVEAIVKTRSMLPDLIVLDLMLPGLNGFEICESLRQDPVTANIPVIILTGMPGQFGRFAGHESGANGFLLKPFDPAQLVSKVEELLAARKTKAHIAAPRRHSHSTAAAKKNH